LGAYWTLRAVVEGKVDPVSGFLLNITEIDAMLRGDVIPSLLESVSPQSLNLVGAMFALQNAFLATERTWTGKPSLHALEWHLTPHTRITIHREKERMLELMQSFEFSASHRLYCSEWSEEENQRVFGHCANKNGHGHNYIVEIVARGLPDAGAGTILDLDHLQRIVKERVIDRFDHKHLNLDCPEFTGLNPSVENIASVIWNLLRDQFDRGALARVRVWETPKTYAEYSGEFPEVG